MACCAIIIIACRTQTPAPSTSKSKEKNVSFFLSDIFPFVDSSLENNINISFNFSHSTRCFLSIHSSTRANEKQIFEQRIFNKPLLRLQALITFSLRIQISNYISFSFMSFSIWVILCRRTMPRHTHTHSQGNGSGVSQQDHWWEKETGKFSSTREMQTHHHCHALNASFIQRRWENKFN